MSQGDRIPEHPHPPTEVMGESNAGANPSHAPSRSHNSATSASPSIANALQQNNELLNQLLTQMIQQNQQQNPSSLPPTPPPRLVNNRTPSGSTAVTYLEFLSYKPTNFKGSVKHTEAEEWLKSIEATFELIDKEIPDRDKVQFATAMLKDDARTWWTTMLARLAPAADIT